MIDKSISWEDYLQINRMNPSTAVAGCKSMRSLHRRIAEGFGEPTKPMRFGSGVHCLMLEPDEFEERYAVMPPFHLDGDNRTKDGSRSRMRTTSYCQAKEAEYALMNQGKVIIEREDYDRALHCIEALRERSHISERFQTENREVTVTGEIEGIECKGRIDLLHPSEIVDLKNTDDLCQFSRVFWDKEYSFKMAFYYELIRQNTCERDVKVIAQETRGDFDNALISVERDMILDSLSEVMNVLSRYKAALSSGIWHGWDQGEKEVVMERPYWRKKKAVELEWTGSDVGQHTELIEQESPF